MVKPFEVADAILTDREHDVIRLIAAGKVNKEIAAWYSISEHTVKFHTNQIVRKMGQHTRTGAVVMALKLGALKLEDVDFELGAPPPPQVKTSTFTPPAKAYREDHRCAFIQEGKEKEHALPDGDALTEAWCHGCDHYLCENCDTYVGGMEQHDVKAHKKFNQEKA